MASIQPPSISFDDAKKSLAHWEDDQEDIFIDLMVEHLLKGNRITNTFGGATWKKICFEFYMKTGKRYKIKQFQNKYNQLRKNYRTFTDLKKLPTGFGWDSVLNTATASDDVWERHIREHPEAKIFRKETCRKYDELVTIFDDTTATGKEAHASTQDILDNDDDTQDTTFATMDNASIDIKEDSQQPRNRRRPRDATPSGNRRVRSNIFRGLELSDAVKLSAEASYAMTNVISQRPASASSTGASPTVGPYSVTSCIKILESIDGVDMSTYLKAVEKFQDKRWRETFIAMSSVRRLGWLASLL